MFARTLALCCAVSVGLPAAAYAQPADGASSADDPLAAAETLYNKGRASFETADYLKAIDLWTEAYGLVDDTPENAAIKAALIYNIASAQEKAYDIDTDVAHLRQAAVLLETYARSVPAMYGEGPEADAEMEKVQTRLDELQARIEEAEAKAAEAQPKDEPDVVPPPVVEPEPARETDPTARPLIISGAVVAGLGLAGLGVMAAGLAMGNAANDVSDLDPNEPSERRDQFARGRTGNTLALAGGVAGGVLIASGAVLIGLGVKRKNTGSVALAPYGGRGQAGLSLSGRF
ncbi:MAG: hypothetical protein AAGA54_06095 [Myxococcota bacterium]